MRFHVRTIFKLLLRYQFFLDFLFFFLSIILFMLFIIFVLDVFYISFFNDEQFVLPIKTYISEYILQMVSNEF